MAFLNKANIGGQEYDLQDARLNENAETGNIDVAKPIVETMSGYSVAEGTLDSQPVTIENVYQGVVRNGNKLTFVSAMNITRTGDLTNYGHWIKPYVFTIPSDVHNKLYPFKTASAYGDILSWVDIYCVNDPAGTPAHIAGFSIKESSNKVAVYFRFLNQLTANSKYYVRFEATFLLSDNLIS